MRIEPKYTVNLSDEEVKALRDVVDDSKASRTTKVKAEILLDLDGKEKPYVIVEGLISVYGVSKSLIYRLIRRYAQKGIGAVKKSPNTTSRRPHRMTPEVQKTILSWIKTPPPESKNRWSAYTIAEKLMEEGLAENISYQTIYRFLSKNGLKF